MIRLKIALIVLGGVLGFYGIQELRVSSGTSSEPTPTVLAKVEEGEKPKSNYVQLDEHIAVYPMCVYSYKQSKSDKGTTPSPTATVQYCYYPVIRKGHPYVEKLVKLLSQPGALKNPNLELPKLEGGAILVKTERFKTIGDIPTGIRTEKSVEGLIINDIDSLSDKETKFLREGMPALNEEKILILEEGRKPSSKIKAIAMIGGGVVLAGAGLVWMLARRR